MALWSQSDKLGKGNAMATWHQERAGLGALYAPHETAWKVVMNPLGEMASAIAFPDIESARRYVARRGGAIIAPQKREPLWYVMVSYRTPSKRESCETFIIRGRDENAAFDEAKRRLACNKRRCVASAVSLVSCREIDGIATC